MHRSTERILTHTAAASSARREIIEGMKARTIGKPYDEAKLDADIRQGVNEVVRKQVEVGIDIVNDGEFGRRGFTSYIHERLSGLEPRDRRAGRVQARPGRRAGSLPGVLRTIRQALSLSSGCTPRSRWRRSRTRRPSSSGSALPDRSATRAQAYVQKDIAHPQERGSGAERRGRRSSPPSRRPHATDDSDVDKVLPHARGVPVRTRRRDARGIQGHHRRRLYPPVRLRRAESARVSSSGPRRTRDAARTARELAVEILNHALRDIPEDRVRYHHCWGSNNRPHTTDTPLTEILPQMLKIKAQAYGFEAANPRHEHEWMVWKDVKLPDGKILIPGLISQSTNVVEHPELVAWRIKNFASVVGKENLIAGVDCGFSQYWDQIRVHPTVQWAKLQALAEGARLASKELWATG